MKFVLSSLAWVICCNVAAWVLTVDLTWRVIVLAVVMSTVSSLLDKTWS